jgi:hypothetical protein
MANLSYLYPVFAFTLVLISLALIPRESYRVFLPVIFLATLVHAGLLYLAINIVDAWQYAANEPFSVFGIPIFILIAWGPSLALFLWGLPLGLPRWAHYVYIASFALAGTIIDATLHSVGIRPYSPWFSGWMWFFPLFFIFWLTYALYLKRLELEETR